MLAALSGGACGDINDIAVKNTAGTAGDGNVSGDNGGSFGNGGDGTGAVSKGAAGPGTAGRGDATSGSGDGGDGQVLAGGAGGVATGGTSAGGTSAGSSGTSVGGTGGTSVGGTGGTSVGGTGGTSGGGTGGTSGGGPSAACTKWCSGAMGVVAECAGIGLAANVDTEAKCIAHCTAPEAAGATGLSCWNMHLGFVVAGTGATKATHCPHASGAPGNNVCAETK